MISFRTILIIFVTLLFGSHYLAYVSTVHFFAITDNMHKKILAAAFLFCLCQLYFVVNPHFRAGKLIHPGGLPSVGVLAGIISKSPDGDRCGLDHYRCLSADGISTEAGDARL